VPNAPRIELPRPAIIAAVGLLILAVTFVVTNGKETGTSAPAPATSSGSTSTTPTTSTSSTSATTTGTGTTTTTPSVPPQPKLTAGPGLPRDVAAALNSNKVVVLFFYEPAAADDQATKAAVAAVRSATGPAGQRVVRLFSDIVAHISNYSRVVGSLGISQSPAMVVIDRHRNARLFEGYLDAGTIRQSVRDAI
jgi:hypothetical protein